MLADDEKTLAGLLLALGVVLALYVPSLSTFFADFLLPSLFCVMVFSLLPFARLGSERLLQLHPIVISLIFWQQLVLPILAILFGNFIGLDNQIIFFIVLTLTSGSLFASPTLVQLMGLDQRIAVQTVVLSTLAAPIFIYLFFSVLHAAPVDLDLFKFAIRLFLFLVIPITIFLLVRRVIHNWNEEEKDKVDRVGRWGSVISLIIFCFALEDEVNMHIASNAQVVISYLVIAIVTAICVAIMTRIVLSRFGARAAATATVLATFRNVGLTFGLVGSIAGPEVAVYVGVCQIPMFIAPLFFDLFIGRSRYREREEFPDIDGQISEGLSPAKAHQLEPPGRSWFGGTKPPARLNRAETLAQLTTTIEQLQETASRRVNPAMTNHQADNSAPVTAAYQGNAAVALEAEHIAATPQPDDMSEEAVVERMNHARSLLENLECEMRKAQQTVMGHPGRFLGVMLLVAVLAIAAIVQGNRYVYRMLFDYDLMSEIAQTHTEGLNYGVYDLNLNIRDLRNETIKRMTKTPELVVWGASHWQEAHVDLLPQYDFYNSHIHRDYYEDMMANAEMWERHGRMPEELIITIRDNLLTPVSERTDFLWYPGIKYYQAFAERIGFEAHPYWVTAPYETLREVVSLPLLWTQAKHDFLTPDRPRPTKDRNFEHLDTLLPGGSILWSGEHKRLFNQERARREALEFAAYKRENPPQIDPKGVEHMEALFDWLTKKGVKVTLAHPQFNPVFWEAVQGSPYIDGLERIKDLTKQWAERYGFKIIGGFEPEAVGCRAEQYIDAEHGDPACLGALLAQYDVVNGRASAPAPDAVAKPSTEAPAAGGILDAISGLLRGTIN